MEILVWLNWGVVIGLGVLSVILLMGKGSFMIAGYNTLSTEKKQAYKEKGLCRMMGAGFSILTIMLGITAYFQFQLPVFLSWIFPWGLLGGLAIILILGNTVCKVE